MGSIDLDLMAIQNEFPISEVFLYFHIVSLHNYKFAKDHDMNFTLKVSICWKKSSV